MKLLCLYTEERYQYQRVRSTSFQAASELMQYWAVHHWQCNLKHDCEK